MHGSPRGGWTDSSANQGFGLCDAHYNPRAMHTDLSLKYLLNVPSHRPDTEAMPMVILMHGRGADAHDLADLAPLIDPPAGCRLVFPNAPRAWEASPGMTFGWTWFDGWPPEPASVAASREVLLK